MLEVVERRMPFKLGSIEFNSLLNTRRLEVKRFLGLKNKIGDQRKSDFPFGNRFVGRNQTMFPYKKLIQINHIFRKLSIICIPVVEGSAGEGSAGEG